jgi:hypothetical protein
MNEQRPIENTDQDIEAGCVHDLTIGCVFQNEAPYLKEWIEFHKIVGVQRFVLVDDRSSDDFMETLQPYIDAGEVELFSHPCPEQMCALDWREYQCTVHCTLVKHLRGVSRWLALVDTDEFIVPSNTNNVMDFLHRYEQCGGVYIRWEPFGTSYVAKLSDRELITERLYLKWRFRKGSEMLGKSIVKPHRVLQANIHRCDLLPGFKYFDCNPEMESETSPIKIYHYWSRDEQFLLNCKLPRTAKIKGWEIDQQMLEYFLALFNDVPDHSMRRFTRELRSRIFD